MRVKSSRIPIIDIKKYGGKDVAIVKGKIAASGDTSLEVIERAKKRFPGIKTTDILVVRVPTSLHVIYLINEPSLLSLRDPLQGRQAD